MVGGLVRVVFIGADVEEDDGYGVVFMLMPHATTIPPHVNERL
jgi:hypothetical protein